MTRISPVRTLASAIAALSLTALPALAQEPGAASAAAPAAAEAPPAAAPAPPGAVSATVAAAAAPKAPDDMTGSLGFGVGVIPNPQLAGTNGQVAVKYWIKDTLALVPALNFSVSKSTGINTAWAVNPEAVVLFVPFKSTSTRFLVGGGLGLSFSKTSIPMSDVTFRIYLPIQAGLEHFFTRWFSMGIAARTHLFDYSKTGSPYTYSMAINTASLLGSLFFYTD